MTARFFLFCYNLMQGSSISVTSFLRKKRLPVPPVHRQPPAEWGYLLDESAFLQQELNIGALDLFQEHLEHFPLLEGQRRLADRLLVDGVVAARRISRTSYLLPQTSGTPRSMSSRV